MTVPPFTDLAPKATAEVTSVFQRIDWQPVEALVAELHAAKTIFCYGVGREGLMMRGWCMRLMHAGQAAHVVGDMTTPPAGVGDLLLVSAGPGKFATVAALMRVAGEAGARTACLTAQPDAELPQLADLVVPVPAATMAGGAGGSPTPVLPMGTTYETALLLLGDLVVLRLATDQDESALRSRHTNLE